MEKKGKGIGMVSVGKVRGIPGIVIAAGRDAARQEREPRIAAFIWGGKIRPTPTLPFGRWKGAA